MNKSSRQRRFPVKYLSVLLSTILTMAVNMPLVYDADEPIMEIGYGKTILGILLNVVCISFCMMHAIMSVKKYSEKESPDGFIYGFLSATIPTLIFVLVWGMIIIYVPSLLIGIGVAREAIQTNPIVYLALLCVCPPPLFGLIMLGVFTALFEVVFNWWEKRNIKAVVWPDQLTESA